VTRDSENLRFNVYVDAMITGDFDSKTQGEIAVLLGVDPHTVWDWKKKADWAAIKDARRKLYSHQVLKIDAAMIKAAEAGDVQAAKIIYERFDGWTPTTAQISLSAPDDELKAEAAKIRAEQEAKNGQNGPDIPGTGAAQTA